MPFLSHGSIHGGLGDVMADAVAAAKSVGLCVECKDILVNVPLQPSYHNVVCSPCGKNQFNYSAAAIAAGPLTYKTDLSHAGMAPAASAQEQASYYNQVMAFKPPVSLAPAPTPFHMTPPTLAPSPSTTLDPVPPSQPPATPGAAGSGVSTADIHHADATAQANALLAANANASSWDFTAPGFWSTTNGYIVMGGAAALAAFLLLGKK